MMRAVLTIARRDITATIFSKGFVIWLAMPIIALVFGVLASLATERSSPSATALAVIDTKGDFVPWLQKVADRERAQDGYDRLRRRWQATRQNEPLPPDLTRSGDMLTGNDLDRLAVPGALDTIRERVNLGSAQLDKALHKAARTSAFVTVSPEAAPEAQAARLLTARDGKPGRFGAVLIIDDNDFTVLRQRKDANIDHITQMANTAWTLRALHLAGLVGRIDEIRSEQPTIAVKNIALSSAHNESGKQRGAAFATGAAMILFALISLLAGALLSNMVEEKANKIIEVLVASVPVPAIFAGKLVAMLTVSLIGVAVWGVMIGGAAAFVIAQLPVGLISTPERGWTELAVLGLAYFVCAYLIYGALYLGIGSLCSSIREVQTLSMPVTVLQMAILIVTLGALDSPENTWGQAVSWFPLSAPYMMAGRAALGTDLAVHAAAILWQLSFAALVILGSARLFRYGVLRSGPPPSFNQMFGLGKPARPATTER